MDYPNEAYERVAAGLTDVTDPADDTEYEEHVVDSCSRGTLSRQSGACICLAEDSPVIPKRGDRVRFFGRGFGFPVRGIAVVADDGSMQVVRYTPPKQFAEQEWEQHVEYQRDFAERQKEPIAVSDGKRSFTDDMRQISGFGGGYEIACRKMVLAGLCWLDEHPEAEPKIHGWKGIYGVIEEDNADAKALSAVVMAACDGCSGAMHQAAMTTVLWIKANGWESYVEKMKAAKGEQRDQDAARTP